MRDADWDDPAVCGVAYHSHDAERERGFRIDRAGRLVGLV
jgi:hypothetical protein